MRWHQQDVRANGKVQTTHTSLAGSAHNTSAEKCNAELSYSQHFNSYSVASKLAVHSLSIAFIGIS